MKIQSVRIQNFRAFEDETVFLDDYTCLVGPNGAGKSTILTALNVFFRETASASTDLVNLGEEDFHKCQTTQPIKITLTFTDISPEAAEGLKAYVRQGKLVISAIAEWDDRSESAQVKQYGQRLGIEQFRTYFEKEKAGAPAKELQQFFVGLRQTFPDLTEAKTKAAMEQALHEYETARTDQCVLIPSEDQFYGVSRGTNLLQKYLQWVFVPAVKDATTEQAEAKNTALGRLLARRVHSQIALDKPIDEIKQHAIEQYQDLLTSNASALKGVSDSLNARFQKWAHQNASIKLDWQGGEDKITISQPTAEIEAAEGPFKGELARFGHGLQRSFIFALLEELAEHEDTGPTLVLACEEPELYQHPPQARYLASLLQRLSSHNSQILVCTHSPYFATGRSFENIRILRKHPQTGCACASHATFEQIADRIAEATKQKPTKPGGIAAKIEQDMQGQMNEMFFAAVPVFVEGLEDVAYVSSCMTLLGLWDDFRSLGCHLIQVQGKSNLIYALALANQLTIAAFCIFDADGDTPEDTPEKTTGNRTRHEKDNITILRLTGVEKPTAFPAETFWGNGVVSWQTKIGDVVDSEIGPEEILKLKDAVRTKYGIVVRDVAKNSLFIGYLMAEAREQGKRLPTSEKLCRSIIDYAKAMNDQTKAVSEAAPTVEVVPAAPRANVQIK